MGMRGRKRKDRRKKAANHGKRPNACFLPDGVIPRRETSPYTAVS